MMCQERSGFLFAHDCDAPAQRACGQCHKSICEPHSREHEGAFYCVTCFGQLGVARQNPDAEQAKQQPQNQTPVADDIDSYHDDPYTYSSRHYHGYRSYDTRDYRAFDRTAASAPTDTADVEKDFAGS